MSFINWGNESPEQLALRRRFEEQAMLEQARNFARIRATQTGIGGGSLPISGNYWILEWTLDNESGYPFVAQSATVDGDGNVSLLSVNDDTDDVFIRRSVDRTGNELNYGVYNNLTVAVDSTPNRIRVDQNGNVYELLNSAIRKLTPIGTVIWEKYFDLSSYDLMEIGAVVAPNGNLYTTCDTNDNKILVTSWNTVNGGLISEIGITIDEASNLYTQTDVVVASNGDIVVALAFYSNDGYGTTIVKLDSDLNVLWSTTIVGDDYGDDQDATGLGMDADGNVYVNGYGYGLTKIAPNGNIVWARMSSDYLPGLAVTPDGDSYMVGDYSDGLTVVKIDTDGYFQWAYKLQPTDGSVNSEGWEDTANSLAQYGDDAILVAASVYHGDYDHEAFFKLPLTKLTGTYGLFNSYDLSNEISLTTVSPTDRNFTLNVTAPPTAIHQTVSPDYSPHLTDMTSQITRI